MENDYRKDFPLLKANKDLVYIDNAATAQRPECVIQAEKKFYEEENANPLRGFYPLSLAATDRYQGARETVKDFIHAKTADEIVFTRNTTESLNLTAYSYGLSHLKEGDEIAVTIMEHHSNLLPWQIVARQTGASLRFLECEPDGTFSPEVLKQGINEHTKLLAVTHVSNVLGCVNPVKEMASLAHQAGAVVVMDGAQSVPHMPVDVQDLDVDFLAFSGHKLMGPMGIGVLYGKKELLQEMPPFLTGGEMISSVSRESAVFAQVPQKFEAGTVNAAGAAGLQAAISYIQRLGFETIMKKEQELTARAMEGLAKLPYVKVLGSPDPKNHTGIVAFVIEGVHPHDVSEVLAADGIAVRAGHHCAQPLLEYLGVRNATRASFMFYNTPEEVDQFVESTASVRRRMGYGE
nr:SufS family cysteine desulfurase [uncultured Blautia sp.]